jgi:predicted nucleic acid-binding protein
MQAGSDVIIDTNVVAYAVLGPEDLRDTAWRALAAVDEVVVPDLFFAEYGNVVWQWARRLEVGAAEFLGALDHGEALVERVLPVERLWRAAVGLALRRGHPVYDAVYVAAAEREGSVVLTFDRRLHAAFPELTVDAGAGDSGQP